MKTWLTLLLLLVSTVALAAPEERLAAVERRALDTFFSNFSEAALPSFRKNELTDTVLLQFALSHAYINRFKSLVRSPDGSSVLVPDAMVDEITLKYFGRKIVSHDQPSYAVPLADGEAYTFSQIGELTKQGKGLWHAHGAIYVTGSGGTPDPHGTPAQWQRQGEAVTKAGTFSALIERREGRYILVEYRAD
jgi:hypothetical protein